LRTIEWREGVAMTVDQSKLPHKQLIVKMINCSDVADAIRSMKIRGAPLIGVIAGYGLALTAYHSETNERKKLLVELNQCAQNLRKTRPTAVNLFWALDRVLNKARETEGNVRVVKDAVIEEAMKMADEDVKVNKTIGKFGSMLIEDGDTILTHCNAGSLATVDYGTALGVLRTAWKEGKHIKVIATETRPLLQGSRLTTYELLQEGIPVKLITDSMVGYVLSGGLIDKIVVGADRIVSDAVINKIGTYTLAVVAKENNVPFYVAAPDSTFDWKRSSKDVIIEERKADEVTKFMGIQVAPIDVEVFNPAFDITPFKYVTAIISEKGILYPKDL
jgi:methylthioribose-1-phosphate isomerase